MDIDWTELEDQLYSLCSDELRTFAAEHQDETFYAFALDCNSDYGQVLLCLNTPEDLREQAIKYSQGSSFEGFERQMAEKRGEVYQPPPRKSPEEYEKELYWGLGDWKYQGFNSKAFEAKWEPFAELVADACLEEESERSPSPIEDRFMRTACRVLIRLENAGAFDSLQRTADFKTWVADHDELDRNSWERLEEVRREVGRPKHS